ncbi:4935_t:CDS:2, partial [Cetraspora pellucida]
LRAKMSKKEIATFAAGCFWGVEHIFRKHFKNIKTQVGYTGGTTSNPDYRQASFLLRLISSY